MRVCNICYAEIKEGSGEICEECIERKPARELRRCGVSDEEIIERFLELKVRREINIEILTDRLRRKSCKYEKI